MYFIMGKVKCYPIRDKLNGLEDMNMETESYRSYLGKLKCKRGVMGKQNIKRDNVVKREGSESDNNFFVLKHRSWE